MLGRGRGGMRLGGGACWVGERWDEARRWGMLGRGEVG